MNVKVRQIQFLLIDLLRLMIVLLLLVSVPWQATWANVTKIDGHLQFDERQLHALHSHDTPHHLLHDVLFSHHHYDEQVNEPHDHAHFVFLSLISAELPPVMPTRPIVPNHFLQPSFSDPHLARLSRPPLTLI